jgi:hypothetical protein
MKLLWLFFIIGTILLIPAPTLAQGCQGVMSPQYSSYDSESYDNTNLYVNETVDGYTTIGNTEFCNISGTTHHAWVNNTLNGKGGWQAGPYVAPASYISFTNSQFIPAHPGVNYSNTIQAEVLCSAVGDIFGTPSSVFGYAIHLSAYIFSGLSNGRCTWTPTCAGACSSQHTTNTNSGGGCFTTGPYIQCADVTKDGKCWDYRTICYGKSAPGLCS